MAQWRIELTTEDVVALTRGLEIATSAVDEEQDVADATVDVVITLLDV